MILRALSRPQRQLSIALSLIGPSCSPARPPAPWKHLCVSARRGLINQPTGFEGHRLPTLPHDETYGEHGVDNFLSPEGFDLAWTQYQSMMIEKLNAMTIGMLREEDC